jgi:hypothetical protein
MQTYMELKKRKSGFIVLLSVLVFGAVGLAVTASLLISGVGASRTSFAVEQSYQAWALADACAEEALQQIAAATSFTGSGNLTLGEGDCSYTVTSRGGQNRTIEAEGTVDNTVRRVEVTIDQISPTINIASWQEVADF